MLKRKRYGIAMVELIFAIVIMGFAMMSIPNLLGLSARSGYTALQQEAIATASSDISLILAREWDESNTIKSIGEIILSTSGDSNLNSRAGGRSRSYNLNTLSASSISSLKADKDMDNHLDNDDIDDVNGQPAVKLTTDDDIINRAKRGNIDQNIEITTLVSYISDEEKTGSWDSSQSVIYDYPISPTAESKTTNIKNIKTKLVSKSGVKELEKTIILSAFSCNIGGYKIDRKVLP